MSGAPEDIAETTRRELEIAMSRGMREAEAALGIEHRDGVWWHEAPIPRRWHRCSVWTTGRSGAGGYVERCACGAIRMPTLFDPNPPWMERNQRRRKGRR